MQFFKIYTISAMALLGLAVGSSAVVLPSAVASVDASATVAQGFNDTSPDSLNVTAQDMAVYTATHSSHESANESSSPTFGTSAAPRLELSRRDRKRFFGRCNAKTQQCHLFQMHSRLGNKKLDHHCSKHHLCMQDGDICGYSPLSMKRTVCDWWYYKRLPEGERKKWPENEEAPPDVDVAVMASGRKGDPYIIELKCKYYGECEAMFKIQKGD
ncbi:Carbonyl reductase family member 4 [Sphaceloma murrayae]|uniref:Carbonyl reductase family member 4 n=1 Tax=Sphaceloma murrayae TaxID=2082308 RepID=A0A2K1QHP4_9PEZI|nr:Carbonyl reductase family member 4 [Sphaceloma murrayae]